MVEKKAFGARGKSGGFGNKPAGGGYSRGPREGGPKKDFGDRKPYAKREGGTYDRKPRAEGSSYGDGERKPYVKRKGGSYERKPRAERSSYGERKPYAPREGGYERKSFGDGERKPYVKREGGSYERKPRAEGSSYGERKPYAKREGGSYERKSFGDGERKPYAKREGGSYERKSFGDGERKPYVKREGGSYERKSFGDGERKPYVKREGGFDRGPRETNYGEGKAARFSEKRTIKRDRTPADQKIGKGDGWLVGYHAVLAALSTGRRKVRAVWLLSDAQGDLAKLIEANPEWPVEIKAKPDFEREFGELVHQGVAALVGNLPQPSLPELLGQMRDKKDGPQLIVALDQVTDPHNLGAVVRSAAAFGASGVLVTEHRAAGLNATAAKVAAGAMEVVPVVEVVNLVQSIEMMQEAGFTVLGMAGESDIEIGEAAATINGPICLVMGSEGEGLRRLTRETCDKLVKIAIAPTMESLNVSVATGVALSILTRK